MIEIRSYRSVFALERRIYRVDRLRLNPGGVPVRGVLYCAAFAAIGAIVAHAPLLGGVVDVLPWYARQLLVPAILAGLLGMIRLDGRPFHVAAVALVGHAVGPRHLCGLRPCAPPGRRWHPRPVLVLPDDPGGRMRRMRYTGPGTVREPASGRALAVSRGARLEIGRGSAWR